MVVIKVKTIATATALLRDLIKNYPNLKFHTSWQYIEGELPVFVEYYVQGKCHNSLYFNLKENSDCTDSEEENNMRYIVDFTDRNGTHIIDDSDSY